MSPESVPPALPPRLPSARTRDYESGNNESGDNEKHPFESVYFSLGSARASVEQPLSRHVSVRVVALRYAAFLVQWLESALVCSLPEDPLQATLLAKRESPKTAVQQAFAGYQEKWSECGTVAVTLICLLAQRLAKAI